MPNLGSLEAELYDHLDFKQAPDTKVVRRLRGYLNETHREILGMKSLTRLRRGLLTFSSVANNPFAVLPQAAAKIIAIADRANTQPLSELLLADVRTGDAGLSSSSSAPHGYIISNLNSPVALDPSAASELFFKSSAAGDDNTKEIFVEGVLTGGYYRSASVAMNGVTAVSLGATITSWIAVTKFYLALTAGGSTTAAGDITLHQTSGVGTELGRISIGRSHARYSRIQLYPTPTAVVTYHADVLLHVQDMVEYGDEPLVPEDFAWLLKCGAQKREYQRKEKHTAVSEEKARWKEGINELKAWVNSTTVSLPRRPLQFSHLGPNFPAGS